jgi:hypothetical protein
LEIFVRAGLIHPEMVAKRQLVHVYYVLIRDKWSARRFDQHPAPTTTNDVNNKSPMWTANDVDSVSLWRDCGGYRSMPGTITIFDSALGILEGEH